VIDHLKNQKKPFKLFEEKSKFHKNLLTYGRKNRKTPCPVTTYNPTPSLCPLITPLFGKSCRARVGRIRSDRIELDSIGPTFFDPIQSDHVFETSQSDQVFQTPQFPIKFFFLGNPIRYFQYGLPTPAVGGFKWSTVVNYMVSDLLILKLQLYIGSDRFGDN
jgi:hypothetical protein